MVIILISFVAVIRISCLLYLQSLITTNALSQQTIKIKKLDSDGEKKG